MARLIATTVRGLEDVAAADLEESFGLAAWSLGPGALRFDVGGDEGGPGAEVAETIVRLNRWARSIHRVGLLLAEGPAARPEDCYELSRRPDYAALISSGQSFAIRAHRYGDHDFGSPDIGREVGQAVIDAFRETTGHRLPVDLDEPEVILRAQLIDDRFRLWLDTTGDASLHRRGWRRGWHPAALKASLAYLLLRLGGWRGEPLVDPFCGSGTIPIEAALAALGVPPSRFRQEDLAYRRLRWIPPGAADGAAGPTSPPSPPDEAPLAYGVDRSTRHVQLAFDHVAAAGVVEQVRIVEGDVADLAELLGDAGGHVRLAATNPPFGRRVGSTREIERAYPALAGAAADVGLQRVVTLVERGRPEETMTAALEAGGYGIAELRPVTYGSLDTAILVAEA